MMLPAAGHVLLLVRCCFAHETYRKVFPQPVQKYLWWLQRAGHPKMLEIRRCLLLVHAHEPRRHSIILDQWHDLGKSSLRRFPQLAGAARCCAACGAGDECAAAFRARDAWLPSTPVRHRLAGARVDRSRTAGDRGMVTWCLSSVATCTVPGIAQFDPVVRVLGIAAASTPFGDRSRARLHGCSHLHHRSSHGTAPRKAYHLEPCPAPPSLSREPAPVVCYARGCAPRQQQ